MRPQSLAERELSPVTEPAFGPISARESTFKSAGEHLAPEDEIGAELRVQVLSRMLRILGGAVLIASASIFMLQHWQTGGDVTRYLLLLAHTATLSGAGFFCGLGIRESKGARTFLGIVLAVVPVHFAVLGGLVYSQFGVRAGALPAFATWTASSPAAALVTLGGALTVLGPLCYLSFLTLARPHARWLTAVFLISSAALLVPSRTPGWVGWAVLAQTAGLLWFETARLRGHSALQTVEGKVVRGLLAASPAVMVGRSLGFYAASDFLLGTLFASMAATVFVLGPLVSRHRGVGKTLQALSTLPAAAAWLEFTSTVFTRWPAPEELRLPLLALPLAAVLVGMSSVCLGNGVGYRRAAALVALGGMAGNLVFYPGWLTSFGCLVTGIGIVVYGYLVQQKALFLAGSAGVAFGLGYNLRYALELYSLNQWASLAGLGIVIVLGASVLERHHARLRAVAARIRSRWGAWDY